MATEKRLIEIPSDGIICIPIMEGNTTVGEGRVDLSWYPTVDAVEVVHGRWIDDGGLDEDGNGQYRCSCCGVGEKHNPTVTVSYCWNCGAKMDGDGNG